MTKPPSLRAMLREGKGRISAGRAEEVTALLRTHPARLEELLECMWDDDPGVANRAAQALERLTRPGEPAPLPLPEAWKTPLLGLLAEAMENKLRWHLAAIVPRLELSRLESARAAFHLQSWLQDESSSIVKTMSLQGLADLIRQDPALLPMVLDLLRIHGRSGTPAMRARSRLLLKKLENLRPERVF
jgi:hypothetical protein